MLGGVVIIKTNAGIIVFISQISIHMLFLLDRRCTVMITFTQQEQDMCGSSPFPFYRLLCFLKDITFPLDDLGETFRALSKWPL